MPQASFDSSTHFAPPRVPFPYLFPVSGGREGCVTNHTQFGVCFFPNNSQMRQHPLMAHGMSQSLNLFCL